MGAGGTRSPCAPLQTVMPACDNSIRTVMIQLQKIVRDFEITWKVVGCAARTNCLGKTRSKPTFCLACMFIFYFWSCFLLKVLHGGRIGRLGSSFQHKNKNKTFYSAQHRIFSFTKHSTQHFTLGHHPGWCLGNVPDVIQPARVCSEAVTGKGAPLVTYTHHSFREIGVVALNKLMNWLSWLPFLKIFFLKSLFMFILYVQPRWWKCHCTVLPPPCLAAAQMLPEKVFTGCNPIFSLIL